MFGFDFGDWLLLLLLMAVLHSFTLCFLVFLVFLLRLIVLHFNKLIDHLFQLAQCAEVEVVSDVEARVEKAYKLLRTILLLQNLLTKEELLFLFLVNLHLNSQIIITTI